MTTAEQLAKRHARAFAGQSRPWSASEFETLLANKHVHLTDLSHGFAVTRTVAGETEILTIATDPDHRRQGIGRRLLRSLEAEARDLQSAQIFLEVSEKNTPARALYTAAGYEETARRKAYYQSPDGTRADALILSKPL